jgi:pimeloyl-ACP methyl ester carboxylesterase
MNRKRLGVVVLAIIAILLSWWQVSAPQSGLSVRALTRDGVPLLYLVRTDAARAPGVLVAHGFAGSKQVMLGYGYTLAHAGYAVMLWDFDGHAANPAPLDRAAGLQRNVDAALAVLLEQPEVDAARLALVGHSMGSGVAMNAGITAPERYAAVVAISPTGAEVTAEAPRNLLLQAGSWEGRFVANAESLLAAAGGPGADLAGGRARQLTVIPNVEHMSILFSPVSHRATLDWLNGTFGLITETSYTDRRMVWYLLHLLAWLGLTVAVGPALRSGVSAENHTPHWKRWLGLAAGPVVAVLGLAGLDRLLPVANLGGLAVGGAVALWLLIGGVVWLGFQRPLSRPAPGGIVLGLLLFTILSLAFGTMAQGVWVQWWLILPRLWRWPLLAVACVPWFLAAGHAQWGARPATRVLWWLAQSAVLVGGLFVTLLLVPSMGFLVLLMPLLPVLLGVFAVITAAFDRPWPYAVGTALFFGWVLAAVFTLV